MRGRTLASAFIILDEAQNTTPQQMKMFLTRLGEGSRMVVTGDPSQVDLPAGVSSGLDDALAILKGGRRHLPYRLHRRRHRAPCAGGPHRHPPMTRIAEKIARTPSAKMIAAIDIADDAWAARCGSGAVDGSCYRGGLASMPGRTRMSRSACSLRATPRRLDSTPQWRRRTMPPNVLSFPAPKQQDVPEGEPRPLGDLILAAGTVAREADEQGKPLKSHLTHLIVHGTLHLLGFDHVEEAEAERMEAAEIAILAGLGVPDPYTP